MEALNNKVFDEVQGHLTAAVDNSIAGIRYFRVQSDGPKLTKVCDSNPLVPRYNNEFNLVLLVVWTSSDFQCEKN